jgi:flavin-dependent dehydrogenase
MSKQFDVIIVGAGPAGLECAGVLKDSAYTVLVLERKHTIGSKPCAGGIVESVEPFDLPDHQAAILYRHQIHIRNSIHWFTSKMPIKVVDRLDLGQHQLRQLDDSPHITLRNGLSVRKIEKGRVHTNDGDYDYRFLVGADGATSVVRRYLKLPLKYTIGVYYDIPDITEHIIIYLDGKSLGTGYIWEFPHRHFTNVGIHYNPARLSTARAGELLHAYMKRKHYRVDAGTYRAFPIMHCYQGCEFENRIFLAGDAAGLASKLTGEGVSYALISGREIARRILNPDYTMPSLALLIKQKHKQDKIINWFEKIPMGLNLFYTIFLKAFKHKFILC